MSFDIMRWQMRCRFVRLFNNYFRCQVDLFSTFILKNWWRFSTIISSKEIGWLCYCNSQSKLLLIRFKVLALTFDRRCTTKFFLYQFGQSKLNIIAHCAKLKRNFRFIFGTAHRAVWRAMNKVENNISLHSTHWLWLGSVCTANWRKKNEKNVKKMKVDKFKNLHQMFSQSEYNNNFFRTHHIV